MFLFLFSLLVHNLIVTNYIKSKHMLGEELSAFYLCFQQCLYLYLGSIPEQHDSTAFLIHNKQNFLITT